METDPFRIRDHVADFDDIVGDIVERSERTRSSLPMMGDVAYGDGPAESIDIFFPSGPRKNLPVHMFIHGGYWRMFSKRDYSYIADTVTQAGAIAVIVDYVLMPGQRMAVLVDQVRRAKRWVLEHIAELGGDPSSLTVSGHSAGAHLATFLFTREPEPSNLKSALLLGGLYDLAPLQQSFLHHEIALTEQEVSRFTPLSQRHDRACRVTLAVGEQETRPFHSQLDAFKIHLRDESVPVSVRVLSGRNHMDSVRDLGIPGTEAGDLLSALVSGRP
ncbi:arylformamidase [Rhizobium sp. BK529]|uniref:alpha/beta hydrolase n=1 Tax=unclassified Rhizobium TaxID=2613769 RepID=UPI00104CCD2B|nr:MULTISPECIES: alpha/beta hydrolase [unclassified Rhizobium]MBB3593173.1 arylformamidase [Rhizobium sp. BK529]TCS02972.1 arylformamidase [Rhizobium sp. BK418]